jgi:hypothetical protein
MMYGSDGYASTSHKEKELQTISRRRQAWADAA